MNRSSAYEMVKQMYPESWRTLFAAFAASYGIGTLTILALPFMLAATMEGLHLSSVQAGVLATVEFVAITAASLGISPFINVLPRKCVALTGTAIAVIANLMCIGVNPLGYETVIALRALAGVGCGLALATGNATVANARDPERMAAQMAALFVAMMIAAFLVIPWASATWGYAGVYGAMAGIMFLLSSLLRWLPQHSVTSSAQMGRAVGHERGSSMAAIWILLAILLFAMRDMSAWAFAERLGVEAGFSPTEVGRLFSMQSVLGLAGPLLASVVGSRMGRSFPIIVGVLAAGSTYFFMLYLPGSKVVYTTAVMFLTGTYYFAQSYLMAVAAELDRKGRIVAAAGGFISAGAAVGPALGGYLIQQYGYQGTSWAIALMAALTIVFALLALSALAEHVALQSRDTKYV